MTATRIRVLALGMTVAVALSLGACGPKSPQYDVIIRGGTHTGATPGRVVRGPGWTGWAD